MREVTVENGRAIVMDSNGVPWEVVKIDRPSNGELAMLDSRVVTVSQDRLGIYCIVREIPKPWAVPEILQQLIPDGAVCIDEYGDAYVWESIPVWCGTLKKWRAKQSDLCPDYMEWRDANSWYGHQLGDPPTLLDAPGGDWKKAIWLCDPTEGSET